MPPSQRHTLFVGIDRAVLQDVVVLAERWLAIGDSWDSNGKGMTVDVCIVRFGGD
jgi:hypothetical protein